MCFKQEKAITTLNYKPLKLVDPFTYLSSDISSAESDFNIRLERRALQLTINLFDKIKREFF